MDSDGSRSKISLPARSGRKQWNRLIVCEQVREKGNHEVTRRARGPVVAGWAVSTGTPPPAGGSSPITHIFVCYFILSIDCGALDLGARRTAATNRPTPDGCERLRRLPWPHSRMTSRKCVPFCRRGLKFPSYPPHGCSFRRGVNVVVFHFGDRASLFVLYKGSNILLFDLFCVFSKSAFSSFIIFYFRWSHYAFSNIIPNVIFEDEISNPPLLGSDRILLTTDGKNQEKIIVITSALSPPLYYV